MAGGHEQSVCVCVQVHDVSCYPENILEGDQRGLTEVGREAMEVFQGRSAVASLSDGHRAELAESW